MNRFTFKILLRLLVIFVFIGLSIYTFLQKQYLYASLSAVCCIICIWFLISFITAINIKLKVFFESIQYSDFTVTFNPNDSLGPSFKNLNQELNKVIEAFKDTRAEKEANLQLLHTMIQHIDVGILCVNSLGKIEIINQAAFKLLAVYPLRHLLDLQASRHTELYNKIANLTHGKRTLYQAAAITLAISATVINQRGRNLKIISLQNISSELQNKELNAWQNLTKVLRHEIMNSIAPIVSLVGTMRSIISTDLATAQAYSEPIADLNEALFTIENRGKGIMNFVNAYRDYTSLPAPQISEISVATLLQKLEPLIKNQQKNNGISTIVSQNYKLQCDSDLIEMVLINLVKNAIEAIDEQKNGIITISTLQINASKIIRIEDNGPGIVPEALDKIFIPFYTTKKTGQGIGLSLSKQIMQLHGGDLLVFSQIGQGCTFELRF